MSFNVKNSKETNLEIIKYGNNWELTKSFHKIKNRIILQVPYQAKSSRNEKGGWEGLSNLDENKCGN